MRSLILIIISSITLYKLLIKKHIKRLNKPYRSMRSLILKKISFIILYKFLIQNLLKD